MTLARLKTDLVVQECYEEPLLESIFDQESQRIWSIGGV